MSTEVYTAVTCHFVNKDLNLETVTLQTARFPQTHTSEHIATELARTISDWGIKGKVTCLSADNIANVKAAVDLLRPKVKYDPYFAHTMNLIVNGGLEMYRTYEGNVARE
jgi:hypothetical protein